MKNSRVVLCALLSIALSGCAALNSRNPADVTVFTLPAGPTAGTLTIYDAEGKPLSQAPFQNNASATLPVQGANLRVVLALPDSGTPPAPGASATGDYLSARASNYSGKPIALSPITTLIDAYLSAHPEATQQTAQTKVLAYLGLPPETNPNDFIPISRSYFDPEQFYRSARNVGGIAQLAKQSVADIHAGRTRVYSATRTAGLLRADGESDFVWDIAEGLAGQFDSWAGAKAKGWLLQVTGLNSLLEKLGFGDKENETDKQLRQLTDEIGRLALLVKNVPKSTAYVSRLTALESLTAQVKQKSDFLHQTTTDAPPSAAQIKTDFIDPMNQSLMQTDLHNNQAGSGTDAAGLISLLLIDHPKYFSGYRLPYANYAYDDPLFNQYNQSRALQTQALNLKLEAAHAGDPPQISLAEGYVDELHINLKRQRLMYPNGLKPFGMMGGQAQDGVLDRDTGLFWSEQMRDFYGYDKTIELLKGTRWRLPSPQEVKDMLPSDKIRDLLPADKRGQYRPQYMRHFGFRPRCNDHGCSDFADLGGAGERPLKYLGPGYVTTSHTFQDSLGQTGSGHKHYDVRYTVVNLYSGGEESLVFKYCKRYADVRLPQDEKCYRDRSANAPPADTAIPLLLVADPILPLELSVTFEKGFDPAKGKASARASMRYSDGVWRDVTKEVIWRIGNEVKSDEVHVSNGSNDSGVVQYRKRSSTPMGYTVIAEYPWYVSEKAGHAGKLTASAVIYGNERVVAQPLKSLLLSPASKTTKQYPLTYPLSIRGVLKSGLPIDQTEGLVWSSTEPSLVTISPSGLVTVAKAPTERKDVQIKVKKDGVEGVAYLVLNP